MQTRFTFALVALPLLALFSACGGKAVVESGGYGGGGASASSPSSSESTTATAVTATSSTNDVGQAEAVTATSAQTSASGPPPGCDGQNNCGDEVSGCIGCALDTFCAPAYDDCLSGNECVAYADCFGQCGDPECQSDCAAQFPKGATQYNDLINCVFCDVCPQDCGGGPFGCL